MISYYMKMSHNSTDFCLGNYLSFLLLLFFVCLLWNQSRKVSNVCQTMYPAFRLKYFTSLFAVNNRHLVRNIAFRCLVFFYFIDFATSRDYLATSINHAIFIYLKKVDASEQLKTTNSGSFSPHLQYICSVCYNFSH